MKLNWFLAVAKKTQQLIGTACLNKHVAKMFVEGASIEHDFVSFHIGWFVANSIFKTRSWAEELAVALHVAQGPNMIAIGIKYSLGEADGSVLVLANIEVAWDDACFLLNNVQLRWNHLRFAEQRLMFGKDLQRRTQHHHLSIPLGPPGILPWGPSCAERRSELSRRL